MPLPNLLHARALFAAFALMSGAALTTPAAGQSAVRILVNDEPITTYDIKNRAQMLRVFSRGRQGEKDAIEQLIDEHLMLQEAKRRNVGITDAEVEQEFARRAGSARLSPKQFDQALRQAGVDTETFKDFIRANLGWSEIVRARFRATVDVTEMDVATALTGQEEAGEEQTASEYMLQPIIFVVPDGAGSGVAAARQREANAFRGGFTGCGNSLAQASGMAGVVVKPIVRREDNQLSDSIKEALGSLEIGGITAPQRVDDGFQLLGVCDKKEIAGQTEAEQETREKLVSERGQLLARRYLRDLRSDAAIEYR